MNEEKNNLFYAFEQICIKQLTPKEKKKYWLPLLDYFQDNWETIQNTENAGMTLYIMGLRTVKEQEK